MKSSDSEFEVSLTRKPKSHNQTNFEPQKLKSSSESPKIMTKLILALESPPEINGTLGIPIRNDGTSFVDQSQLLIKISQH